MTSFTSDEGIKRAEQDTVNMRESNKHLQPPDDFRYAVPRVCATCKFIWHDRLGASYCKRPNGPMFSSDGGTEMEMYFHVCNRYKK